MLVVHPAFYISLCIPPREPRRPVLVQQTVKQFPPLGAQRKSHFHLFQNAQGPNTFPQNGAWRCHSTPFDTAVQIGTLFW